MPLSPPPNPALRDALEHVWAAGGPGGPGGVIGLTLGDHGARAIVRAAFGEDGGSGHGHGVAGAGRAARAWRQAAAALAPAGSPSPPAFPPHGQVGARVAAAFEPWVADHLAWLDRRRYAHPDGRLWSEPELRAWLRRAGQALATAAAPAAGGSGVGTDAARADPAGPPQLHYASAAAWRAAQARYGEAPASLLGLLVDHLRGLADAAPPVAPPAPSPMPPSPPTPPADLEARAADLFTRCHREFSALPMTRLLRAELAHLDPRRRAGRRQARLAGLVLDALLAALNRVPTDGLWDAAALIGRARAAGDADADADTDAAADTRAATDSDADTDDPGATAHAHAPTARAAMVGVMRLSVARAVARGCHAGLAAFAADWLGQVARVTPALDELPPAWRAGLEAAGVGADDWRCWHRAAVAAAAASAQAGRPDDGRLTPALVLADAADDPDPDTPRARAARRLAAVVGSLAGVAAGPPAAGSAPAAGPTPMPMPGPDWSARPDAAAAMPLLTRAPHPAWARVLATGWALDSLAVDLTLRHLLRSADEIDGGAALYLAPLAVAATVLGAARLQVAALAAGHPARAMDNAGFWGDAARRGGAVAMAQAFLAADRARGPAGPAGEATWWGPGVLGHLVFHNLQQAVSPGYLERTRRAG